MVATKRRKVNINKSQYFFAMQIYLLSPPTVVGCVACVSLVLCHDQGRPPSIVESLSRLLKAATLSIVGSKFINDDVQIDIQIQKLMMFLRDIEVYFDFPARCLLSQWQPRRCTLIVWDGLHKKNTISSFRREKEFKNFFSFVMWPKWRKEWYDSVAKVPSRVPQLLI